MPGQRTPQDSGGQSQAFVRNTKITYQHKNHGERWFYLACRKGEKGGPVDGKLPSIAPKSTEKIKHRHMSVMGMREGKKSDKSKSHPDFVKNTGNSSSESSTERDPGITGDQKKNPNQRGDATAKTANAPQR